MKARARLASARGRGPIGVRCGGAVVAALALLGTVGWGAIASPVTLGIPTELRSASATQGVVDSITVGAAPEGEVYDSGHGEIFVANDYSANVSVINASSNRVVDSIDVSFEPQAVAYDPVTREVYVANSNSGNVSVITNKTVTATILPWIILGGALSAVAVFAAVVALRVRRGSRSGSGNPHSIGPGPGRP